MTTPDHGRADAAFVLRVGERGWTPLHHPEPVAQFMDAAVLADGRLAVALRSFGPDAASQPRACHVYDPRTAVWTREEAVLPGAEPPFPAGARRPDSGREHWVVLDAGTLLTLSRTEHPLRPRLEPAGPPLPALPTDAPRPDRFDAVRLPDGRLFVLAAHDSEAIVYALTPGAPSWTPLPSPGPGTFHALEAIGGDALAVRGAPERVFDGGSWRTLPPSPGDLLGTTLARFPDGAIALVGGFDTARVVKVAPLALGRKVAAVGVLAGMGLVGLRVVRSPRRPAWPALIAGLVAGALLLGWFLVTALRALAWS